MTVLQLQSLTKAYQPEVPILKGLELEVQSGKLLALLGPSGSGKTTTLRLIAGLTLPTSGDILFDGVSVLSTPPEKRGAVMVFQEHPLFPFMSVGDNVAFGLKLRKLSRQEIFLRVRSALESVQLPGFEDRWADELSGGQKQRVALARALAVRPRLLLLDEPLSNLESSLRLELRQMIRQLQQESGITTIFVTHNQEEAVAIADRIALLLDGELRQVGEAQCFYERPADTEVARFFGNKNFIPGDKQGASVDTPLGKLEINQSSVPDGPVLVTIRPEAIQIGANGYNNIQAKVLKRNFRGAIVYIQVIAKAIALDVFSPLPLSLRAGELIDLHFPGEHLHLMPRSEVGTL